MTMVSRLLCTTLVFVSVEKMPLDCTITRQTTACINTVKFRVNRIFSSKCCNTHIHLPTHIYVGTYDVKYEDGDAEAFVPSSRIRARPSYAVGMAVEANFGGQGKFYSGTIAAANNDGTYDVAYNDGDRERNVSAAMIRPGEVA